MTDINEQYVARITAFKVKSEVPDTSTRRVNPDMGTAPKKTKSDDVSITVKASTLTGLKAKVNAILAVMDEEEFE